METITLILQENHNFISLAFAPLKQLEYKDAWGFGDRQPIAKRELG
jgi:hypothetical protein